MKKHLLFCILGLCLLAGCAAQPVSENTISLEAFEDGGYMIYTPSELDRDTAIIQQLELWLTNILSSESVEIKHEDNRYTVTVTGLDDTISEALASSMIHTALPSEANAAPDIEVIFK